MADTSASTPDGGLSAADTPRWGWLLVIWMALEVMLRGVVWTTGVPDYELAVAVEKGAERVEQRSVGEDSPDVVRKSIQLQRDSLRFWTVIWLVGDFVMAPLWLAARALAVAVGLAAVAAITGRPVRFPAAMKDCVTWQGVWVLGLAVQAALMLILRRSDIVTSVVLFFPPRVYGAREWVLLQQIDGFAMIGWLGMAWSACRRGQAGLLMALVTCLIIALMEFQIRGSFSLLVNLGMHLTIFPE
jgi:hypothetical protein